MKRQICLELTNVTIDMEYVIPANILFLWSKKVICLTF